MAPQVEVCRVDDVVLSYIVIMRVSNAVTGNPGDIVGSLGRLRVMV